MAIWSLGLSGGAPSRTGTAAAPRGGSSSQVVPRATTLTRCPPAHGSFLPQQAPWAAAQAAWEALAPLSPRKAAEEDALSKQELEAQLAAVTRERDQAVSSARLSRLEAAHLRFEKQRLHAGLEALHAEHAAVAARVEKLEGELQEGENIHKASIWFSFCAAKKDLLATQDELTAQASQVHLLKRQVKQEQAEQRQLRKELDAAEAENRDLQALLDSGPACALGQGPGLAPAGPGPGGINGYGDIEPNTTCVALAPLTL